MRELTRLSACEMAEVIRHKQASPVEVLDAHLRRIEQLNPHLNAFACLREQEARQEARSAEAALARNDLLPPLFGVPVTIKSCIDVAGLRCEAGAQVRAGHVALADSPLVAHLKAAGAIVLGNTNVAEMLMSYECDNPLYGRTNNPWDLERTPGGSSGGEAAAIAAGCSAGGLGSDGGGSVRVPAHFCGICALKPTPGRLPATGHFPASLGPFALMGVIGPMARTVGDLRLLFEVLAGPDKGDLFSTPVPVRHPDREAVRHLRVGYFRDDGRTAVTAETSAAVGDAAEALRKAGFQTIPFRPEGLDLARELWQVFFCACALKVLGPIMGGREADLPILTEYLQTAGGRWPGTDEALLTAWLSRDQLRLQLRLQMEDFPVLLCPVAATPAFRHGARRWIVDGREVRYLDAMSYVQWVNLLGLPAAVVPMGRSSEGLPLGVQVVGRPYEDETVLAVAQEIETVCGGWKEPPEGINE